MSTPTSGLLTLAILAGLMMGGIQAWGGLFNRFSPELLSNLGYGANGGGGYRHNQVGAEEAFEPLEPDGALEAPGYALAECGGRSCYSDESCCPGFLCIALNDFENFGRCVPNVAGRKLGEICARDNECEAGLLCEQLVPGEPRICRAPTVGHKQYNQECAVSSECDIARGLCCTMQRRHRQKARKACSYFKDPLLCIGPVATDQIHDHVEHTAGEKRFGFYKRFH